MKQVGCESHCTSREDDGEGGTHSRNTEGTTHQNKETINSKFFSAEKRAAVQIVITL